MMHRRRSITTVGLIFALLLIASVARAKCTKWCHSHLKKWNEKCSWPECSGCDACTSGPVTAAPVTKASVTNGPIAPISESACMQFDDVSSSIFERGRASDAWYSLNHSGRPMKFENTPSFPDFNGDGHLDYFSNGHMKIVSDWDFGVSISSADGSSLGSNQSRVYRNITATTINQTAYLNPSSDTHGVSFADLDGDGVMDMLLTTGGGRGEGNITAEKDALLFWGDEGGGALRLTGGYLESAAAGLAARGARGRFNYLFDANGDGLLDVLAMGDRGVGNFNRAQELRINNGDRTWRPDGGAREFSRTAILTDADGDGRAEELVFQRANCYPQRRGPGADPEKPAYGPYPEEYRKFCRARPRGSTAIYKYNRRSDGMDLISPAYARTAEEEDELLPLGSFNLNSKIATSSVTGDFDGDNKADLVVLYKDKFVVHYSTKRSIGELPLSGVGGGGVDYDIDGECMPRAIRLLDLDLDGKLEMVLMCDEAGKFLMFKPTGILYDWKEVQCGGLPIFGVTNSAFQPTEDDIVEVCGVDGYGKYQPGFKEHCRHYHNGKRSAPRRAEGATFVDMNNDGYLDLVLSTKGGYLRFLHSIPPNPPHNFVVFELKGTASNRYGIGATVIFTARSTPNQFREVSTWSHAADKYGYIENRLIFGLGSAGVPETLTVRWPSGVDQVLEVGDMNWTGSGDMNSPVQVVEPAKNDQSNVL